MEKDSEKNIEKGFTRYADKLGGLSLKFTSPGFTGAPDRVLLIDGVTFWAELKSAGKKPSPRQSYVHKQFFSYGFRVWRIASWVELRAFYDHVKQTIGRS